METLRCIGLALFIFLLASPSFAQTAGKVLYIKSEQGSYNGKKWLRKCNMFPYWSDHLKAVLAPRGINLTYKCVLLDKNSSEDKKAIEDGNNTKFLTWWSSKSSSVKFKVKKYKIYSDKDKNLGSSACFNFERIARRSSNSKVDFKFHCKETKTKKWIWEGTWPIGQSITTGIWGR